MSRQIQIRRGSAAEHENFIGAIGEITMDTTNKILRVHDGETLGGIPMMRADAAAYATAMTGDACYCNQVWVSDEVTISCDKNVTLTHNLNLTQPFMATAIQYIKFCTDVAGYQTNDIICQFNMAPQIYTQSDGTQIIGADLGNILNINTNTVTVPRCVNGKICVYNKSTGIPELCSSECVKTFVKIIY